MPKGKIQMIINKSDKDDIHQAIMLLMRVYKNMVASSLEEARENNFLFNLREENAQQEREQGTSAIAEFTEKESNS